jgi:predicted metalloendopeptidase
MGEDIASLTWMSAATKQQAIIKLRALEVDVGYPEKWRDYSGVRIDRQGWAENAFRAGEFEHQRRIQRIGTPADRYDWYGEEIFGFYDQFPMCRKIFPYWIT